MIQRRDCCTEKGQTGGMDSSCDLLVRDDEPVTDFSLRLHVGGCDADVVDPFEDHGVLQVRLCQHVPVDATDDIRSEAIMQDAVSTGSLVQNGDILCCLVLLHLGQEKVWPTVCLLAVCTLQPLLVIPSVVFSMVAWPSVMLSPMMANERDWDGSRPSTPLMKYLVAIRIPPRQICPLVIHTSARCSEQMNL